MRKVYIVYEESRYGWDPLAIFDNEEEAKKYAKREEALISQEEDREPLIEAHDMPLFASVEEADAISDGIVD